MIEATSTIRDQLYERHLERRYDKKPIRVPAFRVAPNIGRFRARPRDPDAIEIDNLQKRPNAGGKTITCYACGKTGHMSKDCRSKNKVRREINNNTERTVTYYACNKTGHYSKECPNRARRQINSIEGPKEEPQSKQQGHASLS
jgi:hypothetical protein